MTSFRVAMEGDDPLIRSLLRENGFSGWVEMAIEREPSFFAGAGIVGGDWAVIASEEKDVVGMYTASVLPVHVDGRAEDVGYLGGLRVAPRHRRRIRHLRGGYASIRPLARAETTVPWWVTSVSAENRVARRLLESGVRGLPTYQPLGGYVTAALSSARGKARGLWRRATDADLERIVEFHNERARKFQLSPALSEGVIRRIGTGNFRIHEKAGEVQAVCALWDQRRFKQVVARRYRQPIAALLPAYNAFARVFRRPVLPRVGHRLEHSFVSFLAFGEEGLDKAEALLQDLLHDCATPIASLGLHAGSPLLEVLERFAPIRYESCIYAVAFGALPKLSPLAVQPEAALL